MTGAPGVNAGATLCEPIAGVPGVSAGTALCWPMAGVALEAARFGVKPAPELGPLVTKTGTPNILLTVTCAYEEKGNNATPVEAKAILQILIINLSTPSKGASQ